MKRIIILILLVLGALSARAQAVVSVPVTNPSQSDSEMPPSDLDMIDYDGEPRRYVVRGVDIHGSDQYNAEMLRTALRLIPGDTITIPGSYISDAIEKAWSLRVFSDVEITASPEGDGVTLDVYLTERPRVRKWTFEGIRKSESEELATNLKLRPGTELSDYVLQKNEYLIEQYFAEKGFRIAKVTPRIVTDTIASHAVNVAFVVDKGPKVRVGDINFIGNGEYTDGQLRRTFKKTHPVSWKFWQSNKYKDEDYEADKDFLVDFYNSKGFRNAMVVSDSVYAINPKRMGIDITVDEGNKFYYRNVSWTGNTIYTSDYLNGLLTIEKGGVYDRKSLHKILGVGREASMEDNQSILAQYQNSGYYTSSIEPAEVVVGTDSLDLDIKIYEGEQFSINNVEITGNQRVNDEVIRREVSTYPGETYSRQLLISTIYRLNSMEHFNPDVLFPSISPVSNNMLDIEWPLEEQPSDKFDVSGGWGAGMFVGSVGIQLNNLSLKNMFKKREWSPYPQGQNQQLAIRGQTNGTYYKAISLSFTEPWLGGKKPHALTLSGYYSAESNAYYIWQTGSAYFRTLGIAAGIGFRLNWPDQYFSLYTELGYQRYMLDNWSGFLMETGNSNVVTFKTVLGRSSVSQPVFPEYGSDFSLSLTLTPPWSLMDKIDYSNKSISDSERYRWIEYHKWAFKGRMFHPLTSGNKRLVLMTKAEMGYLGHYNPNKLSPFEGFRVGGDGMTGYTLYGEDIVAMRGYKDGELIPVGSRHARVYTKYTVELRYPFIQQPQSTIYGLVFAEAGNGYSSWKTFNPFQVKRSAGAGVRIRLPIVGMLGFDWGYGFDRPAGGTKRSGGQIHFTIGQEF